ncbi:hypothetical protein J7E23_12240 [Pseudomonas sp. ISL-88]|uniref:GHMP family kinase ATP-binding protein n=1 Tax=Pseudomonas sp. ISL-88 TaxID=2819169 RepID=UPI001BE6F2DC|nr:hypothetical protein [Pseudomonas sp. ISL-88]MBT2713615.1 hypothetical protein [Pseudomonas sp. ISL-88]
MVFVIKKRTGWANYPNGAGLSSSASIELVTAVILKQSYHLQADMLDLVKRRKILLLG